jgi:hypothetical protein
MLYEKNEKTPAKYDATLHLETDTNGEAQFSLPDPAPAHLAAQLHLTSEHWHCACMVLATTEDLIQKGIVESHRSPNRKSDASDKAEPMEILFLPRPFTLFERMIYPFVKE